MGQSFTNKVTTTSVKNSHGYSIYKHFLVQMDAIHKITVNKTI